MAPTNKRWILRRRPQGEIGPKDLELIDEPLRDLGEGEVLIRTIYLSLDPTNRIWMSDREQYLPPVGIGETMRGGAIGVVERSRSDRFKQGDQVNPGLAGWSTYTIAGADAVSPIPALPGVPLSAYMSVLGATGLTAWFGMTDIGRPQPGETVVVSAAAGAVGSIAGQIARLRGARVIGIAGGKAKCDWLRGELGFDGAIDYRSEDVGAALGRLCPAGVDVDFENVGGPIMDAVISRMNNFGRVALCGMISTYNSEVPASGPHRFRPCADEQAADPRLYRHRLSAARRRGLRRVGPLGDRRPAQVEGPHRGGAGKRRRGGRAPVHRRPRRQAPGARLARALEAGRSVRISEPGWTSVYFALRGGRRQPASQRPPISTWEGPR